MHLAERNTQSRGFPTFPLHYDVKSNTSFVNKGIFFFIFAQRKLGQTIFKRLLNFPSILHTCVKRIRFL